MYPFPYIQEVGKERKTGWISTLRDRKKEGHAMQMKLTIQERLKDLRVERGPVSYTHLTLPTILLV